MPESAKNYVILSLIFELQERRKELTIFALGPEVASGRCEEMLPHFSLGKKAANQLQASKVKVMEGFTLSVFGLAPHHTASISIRYFCGPSF